MPGAFKIVPGLGDALHEAMKKISGVEEIAPAAEGVASAANKHTSTPTGQNRPKSWHGSQVPGKPKINKTLVSEMEGMLAKRRNKVDQEAYVSEGPDPVLPPPEPVCLPPTGARKPSVASVDSGRGASIESNSRNSLEPGGYARVSVDQERKEELMLAKAVRRSSAKMLNRDASPNSLTSPIESPLTVKQEVSPASSLPPPSPVVMRYWKQCSSTADSGYFGEEGMEQDEPARDASGEVIAPWKADAIEGEEQEFPSIASKIKQMEEDAKKPLAMYEVPDVKAKMRTGAPAAKWMEARKLILVNSYFVKDIKGYNRKGRELPKIKVSSETSAAENEISSHFDEATNLDDTDCKSDFDEGQSHVDSSASIEIEVLSRTELCIFFSPLAFLLVFHVWLCLLPAFKLFFFLLAVLACAGFILYHEDSA